MGVRIVSLGMVLVLGCVAAAADPPDVNQLSLEVDALQALAQLALNPDQLKALDKLAQGVAAARDRKPAKASAKYVAALKELREALLQGDADTIDDLNEKTDKLRDSEKPQVDDQITVGEPAKKRASEALKLLTARQTAAYLGNFGEALPDPVERIKTTIHLGQKLAGKQWETARDGAAQEVGWLLAGFDAEQASKVREQATTLLDKFHSPKPQEAALDKATQALYGKIVPTDVLRNILEHDLAELLANPELPTAIQAHLKK